MKLFYRLVGTLRLRTLDAVEAIAVWRRKVRRAAAEESCVLWGTGATGSQTWAGQQHLWVPTGWLREPLVYPRHCA